MHTLIHSTAIAALVAAAPALAQSTISTSQQDAGNSADINQVDDAGNVITVDQLGANSSVEVLQVGADQSIAITQAAGTSGNAALAIQNDIGGQGGSGIVIEQAGSDNLVAAGQNSNANTVATLQSGDANQLFVDQGFLGGAGEEADGNFAAATQSGKRQFRRYHAERKWTPGGANAVEIVQSSDMNSAAVDQEGDANFVVVIQGDLGGAGTNAASVSQSGTANLSAVGQNGADNEAALDQDGTGNEILIDQGFVDAVGEGADGNVAAAAQLGDGNVIGINQNLLTAGGGNLADVSQFGDAFSATVDQEGAGHSMTIVQGTPPAP